MNNYYLKIQTPDATVYIEPDYKKAVTRVVLIEDTFTDEREMWKFREALEKSLPIILKHITLFPSRLSWDGW